MVAQIFDVLGNQLYDPRDFGIRSSGGIAVPRNPFGHDTSIADSIRLHTDWASPDRHIIRPLRQHMTKLSFEQTLIEVWRQTLVENSKSVELGSERYPVR